MSIFSKQKYLSHLVLFFLIILSINFSSTVRANTSSKSQSSDNQQPDNFRDITEIKKVVILDARKRHWHPQNLQIQVEAIVDNFAIVGSHDNFTGGESILEKDRTGWKVICGTGGAFSHPSQLVQSCKMSLLTAQHLLLTREKNRERGFDKLNN